MQVYIAHGQQRSGRAEEWWRCHACWTAEAGERKRVVEALHVLAGQQRPGGRGEERIYNMHKLRHEPTTSMILLV